MVFFIALLMLADLVWIGELGVSQVPAWVVLASFFGASYATIQGFRCSGTLWKNHRRGHASPALEWGELTVFVVSQGVAATGMGVSGSTWWGMALFLIGLGLASAEFSWLRWKRGVDDRARSRAPSPRSNV